MSAAFFIYDICCLLGLPLRDRAAPKPLSELNDEGMSWDS